MSANVGAILLGGAIGIAISIVPVLKDVAENHWRKQFRKQVKQALAAGELEYNDLQHIAERWSQDRKSVLQSLRVMLSDSLGGDEENLSGSRQLIRNLLREHERAEPYSELPENISLQLSTLTKVSEQNSPLVEQLASSLSELYSSNQRQLLRQSRYTVAGAFIVVIGVLIGVFSWLR
jgi:hypothetical protein